MTGDALIPRPAAGGRHLGTGTLAQVLVRSWGIATQSPAVITVTRALTGSPVPDIPWRSVTIILGLVTLLAGLAILGPTTRMVMRRKDA